MKVRASLFMAVALLPLVSGCKGIAPKAYDSKDFSISDEALGLTRDEYRNLPYVDKEGKNTGEAGVPDTKISKGSVEPPIPDLAPILAAPPVPKLGQTKLVTIAVTDDVPLKDVLLELSRLADVDMEIDAGIQGGVTFRATQRPFNEVIERLSEFAGLRYSMKNGVLRVEQDKPYVEIYTLDFLNMERQTTNTVNLSTSVLSTVAGGGSGGGSGLTTGSSTSISSKTESDFWVKFEAGIMQIIAYTPTLRSSDFSAPQAQQVPETAVATNPATTSPAVAAAGAAASGTAAATGATAAAPASSSGTSSQEAANGQYTINRQAGTLTVLATERQHRLVKEFIKRLEYTAAAQVLIEAKIVEVTLNEQYQSGINWTDFGTRGISGDVDYGGLTEGIGSATVSVDKGLVTGLNINLDLAVELMQKFGSTRTLSSPRLHAMNNQQAVLTFAKNEVYFTVTVEKESADTTTGSTDTYTVNSTINTVPIGIIMSLLPSINRETGEITLSVRPTLSRVVDRVIDPGLTLAKALNDFADVNVENKIPVVEVRELDSMLKLKSGQVMVIGGLMEDKGITTELGVPGMQDIPVLGHVFKGVDNSRTTSELVIFIRATMIGESGGVDSPDKAVYEKFTRDPRPLDLR
jgi:MSHA type pilus biogenesis protein MshL